MYASNILLLTLSALTSALPTSPPDASCTGATASGFTLNDFTTFTPSTSNTHPPSVFFAFSNNANSTSRTQCLYSGPVNASATTTCSDGNTVFQWDGSKLTVGEEQIACAAAPGGEISAFGDLTVGMYCYPSPAQVPNGEGTTCQTPTGQVSGQFTRSTLEA